MSEKIKKTNEAKVEGKKYHFISGMPRSGSTLLANILAQNPRFHSTATSGIMDIMFGVRNSWNQLIEFKANPNPTAEIRVLRGILENFFSDIDKPVIFDKSRGWLSELEMIERVLGHNVKVLVPVRDIRDVLSSFEKLWRKNMPYSQNAHHRENYFQYQTVSGRVQINMQPNNTTGLAYNRIIDAVNRGFSKRMFFVDFDDLTKEPKVTMQKIYEFLGEPYFEHDFDNVEQVTKEDDVVHGIQDLHTIRKKVVPLTSDWLQVIGPQFEHFDKLNFWKLKNRTDQNLPPIE